MLNLPENYNIYVKGTFFLPQLPFLHTQYGQYFTLSELMCTLPQLKSWLINY